MSGKCSKSYIRSRLVGNRHTQKFMSLHLRLMVMFVYYTPVWRSQKENFTEVMKSVRIHTAHSWQSLAAKPGWPDSKAHVFHIHSSSHTDSSRPSTFPFFHLSKPTVTWFEAPKEKCSHWNDREYDLLFLIASILIAINSFPWRDCMHSLSPGNTQWHQSHWKY